MREFPGETIIEEATPFANAGRIELGAGFADPHLRRQFTHHDTTRRSTNHRLADVLVDPQTALVFRQGAVVELSRFMPSPDEQRAAEQRIAAPPRRIGGRSFMGFNRIALNYFHWLTQCVPAIAGYTGDPAFAGGTLLLPPLDALHFRALELAGIALPDIDLADTAQPIAAADLSYSTLLTADAAPSPFCRAVFARMAAQADPGASEPAGERIYVWRIDTPSRTMRNEDALVELLLRHDIQPVILSTLTLDAQIALFRNARLVVGAHGAGLANIVFCRPGAIVYELLPAHWAKPSMNVLAQLASLDYWADIHAAESRPHLWRHKTPWSVDLDAVERRVVAILSKKGQGSALDPQGAAAP